MAELKFKTFLRTFKLHAGAKLVERFLERLKEDAHILRWSLCFAEKFLARRILETCRLMVLN